MIRPRDVIRWFLPRKVRNWLRSPVATSRWVLDTVAHNVGFNPSRVIRDGWAIRCHPAAFRTAYRAQIDDAEQRAEFDDFVRHCEEGMTLLDLGAHFGLFSLAALHYGGPTANAVAVDPSPTAIRMIQRQAKLNQLTERVHTIQAAVQGTTGATRMVAVGVLAAGYYVGDDADRPEGELTSVTATTLDDLVRRVQPTHIKMDIEGFEASALEASVTALQNRRVRVVFVELHNQILRARGQRPESITSALERHGFRVSSAIDHDAAIGYDKPVERIRATRT